MELHICNDRSLCFNRSNCYDCYMYHKIDWKMKCKCGNEFEPIYRNDILVSKWCIPCLVSKGKTKREKMWQKEKKELKSGLKTKSEWLKDLQKIFNTYIRVRDKSKPCISCGKMLVNKFDAGHFFSVGAYPNLRFNEDNVHGQCVECNQHKHGNINEYTINLPERIGQERYDLLLDIRSLPLHLSIEEIKEKITFYKGKINTINSKR